MPTMIVWVNWINFKEGVSPEEYEPWALEPCAPAAKTLPSVEDWRDYRVAGLLGSRTHPTSMWSPLEIRSEATPAKHSE
jgi:hypothetical protein